jgi:drug/metabolite transporter (DMT)-like permease
MIWLLIGIAGYFSNAVSTLADKILLNKLISHPSVYAFYVSLFSVLAVVLAPLDLGFPTLTILIVSLLAGVVFTFALLLFFTVLQKGEASRIDPLVGGISPVFVFILALFVLGEALMPNQIIAFVLILSGSFIISAKIDKNDPALDKKVVFLSIAAAFLFALSHVMTKWVYTQNSFVNSLVWRSLGSFLGSIIILAVPFYRRKIIESFEHPKTRTGLIFFAGQFFAAISFILINYAFSLGPITLVNALAGTQYIFLFLLVLPFGKKYPHLLEEKVTKKIVGRKILSIVLVSVGIFILFI